MSFVETQVCAERKHCIQCRTREGGRKWRMLVKRVYGADAVDFACPLGLPWVSDHPRKGDLDPFSNIAPGTPGEPVQAKKPKRVDARVVGDQIFAKQAKLRTLLGPGCVIVKALDAFEEADKQKGGCRGCRRKRMLRKLGAAVNDCTPNEQAIIRLTLAKP